ncbi:MAG: hypothetical protein ABIW85_08975 [Variovorax sp.]
MALEDALCLADRLDGHDGDFCAAFLDYQGIRIVRTARVQLSSVMCHELLHAQGVKRLVRNSIFEGRSDAQSYDRFAWLYTAPPFVHRWKVAGAAIAA